MKICYECKELKEDCEFAKDRHRKDGLQHRCKKCFSIYYAEYYDKVRPKRKKRKPYIRGEANSIEKRARRYGIGEAHYWKMYEEQGGMCKICKKTPKVLVIDHDHVTGKVRGLLCNRCNSVLGFARDNPDVLLSAAGYLRKF